MASTNISIKQSTGVAINVAALKAITVETLQAIKQRVLRIMANGQCSIVNGPLGPMGRLRSVTEQEWSITRLYRQELRMARALARVIDKHSVLASLWIIGWAAFIILYTFLYY